MENFSTIAHLSEWLTRLVCSSFSSNNRAYKLIWEMIDYFLSVWVVEYIISRNISSHLANFSYLSIGTILLLLYYTGSAWFPLSLSTHRSFSSSAQRAVLVFQRVFISHIEFKIISRVPQTMFHITYFSRLLDYAEAGTGLPSCFGDAVDWLAKLQICGLMWYWGPNRLKCMPFRDDFLANRVSDETI